MRRRFVSVLVLEFVVCGLTQAQNAPVTTDGDVTVNMDALSEPLAPAKVETVATPRPKPSASEMAATRLIPVPRQKPAMDTAAIPVATSPAPTIVAVAKPESKLPVITGKASDKPEMPATIVENFPVEMSGVAADPYAGTKTRDPVAGLSILSRVRFTRGDSHLPETAMPTLDALAAQLSDSRQRVRLAAFSGNVGDMSSQSRRLSLERARAVRDYLVSKGVPFDRMDVLPFGGANDGVIDRVDVLAAGT
ncbi:MAG: OmpA family protein [Micropepsaceae bacterium]